MSNTKATCEGKGLSGLHFTSQSILRELEEATEDRCSLLVHSTFLVYLRTTGQGWNNPHRSLIKRFPQANLEAAFFSVEVPLDSAMCQTDLKLSNTPSPLSLKCFHTIFKRTPLPTDILKLSPPNPAIMPLSPPPTSPEEQRGSGIEGRPAHRHRPSPLGPRVALWSGGPCVVILRATAGGGGEGPGGAFGFVSAPTGISVDGQNGSPQVLPMDLGAVSLPQRSGEGASGG